MRFLGDCDKERAPPSGEKISPRMIMTGMSTLLLAVHLLLGGLVGAGCGRVGAITTPSATPAPDLAPTSSFTPSQIQSPAPALTSTAVPTLVVPDTGWGSMSRSRFALFWRSVKSPTMSSKAT